MELPLICLIHRVYPIQVTMFQMEKGLVQRRKIFPLCSSHKGKVLRKQAPLTGFQPQFQTWREISPLCIPTRGKFYTVR